MAWNYHSLMRQVRYYLISEKRKKSFAGRVLSDHVFDKHLWTWEERGIAVGAAWGAAWAIAPVPLQTLFAVASCVWKKGNIPIGVLMCWLSFPGYQVFVWPIQWWIGSKLLSAFGDSGADLQMIVQCAKNIPVSLEQGSWTVLLEPMRTVQLGWLVFELLLGMAVSCVALGVFCYVLVRLFWWVARIGECLFCGKK